MEILIFEILLYETENGKSQVTDFIRKLPRQSRAKLYQITSVMKEKGPEIRMPYSRYLEKGIFEIRIITGLDSFRILYFYPGGRNIVLTNGFRKTTQKTPKAEIKKALRCKADYMRRIQDENY